MLLFFKLLTSPILILMLTWISKKLGNSVVGILIGIPLLTGPISAISAWENGTLFAANAAITNLVGQVSTCLFCFVYYVLSRKGLNYWVCMSLGIITFLLTTLIWHLMTWNLFYATTFLLISIVILLQLMPLVEIDTDAPLPYKPVWDIPVRIILSAIFVTLITFVSKTVGDSLSGLIAPFPVFVLIFSVFTHKYFGVAHVSNLLRGVILGSFCFAAFFLIVG